MGASYLINFFSITVFCLILRLQVYRSMDLSALQRRIELVTPATSWYRVKECVFLVDHGINPYEGDTCHQPPVAIFLFKSLLNYGEYAVLAFFIATDILTGLVLALGAWHFASQKISREKLESSNYKEDAKLLWQKTTDVCNVPYLTLGIYLFNPYTIFSCMAYSTGLTINLLHAMAFFLTVKGYHSVAGVTIAVASYQSFYSVVLLVPVVLQAACKATTESNLKAFCRVSVVVVLYFAALGCLLNVSYKLTSSWDFLHATHGFLWNVPDLTPNIGLFWYFFMEMFDHFRLFFLYIFQINVFLYIIPMAFLFRSRPIFLFYILTSVIALFKSYPAVGDICIPLALIPIWSYVYRYTRTVFITVCVFVFTTVLGPVLYHLWIYLGSGNANFFYAVTLAHGVAQVFLMSDMVTAYLKREFHLIHGMELKTEKGEPGIVIME